MTAQEIRCKEALDALTAAFIFCQCPKKIKLYTNIFNDINKLVIICLPINENKVVH